MKILLDSTGKMVAGIELATRKRWKILKVEKKNLEAELLKRKKVRGKRSYFLANVKINRKTKPHQIKMFLKNSGGNLINLILVFLFNMLS